MLNTNYKVTGTGKTKTDRIEGVDNTVTTQHFT